jgi:hypothetical protein
MAGVDVSPHYKGFGPDAGAFSRRPRACRAPTTKPLCSHRRTSSASSRRSAMWRTSPRRSRTNDWRNRQSAGSAIATVLRAMLLDLSVSPSAMTGPPGHRSTVLLDAIPIGINLSTRPQTLPQIARCSKAFPSHIEKSRPTTETSLSVRRPFSRPSTPSRPPRRA